MLTVLFFVPQLRDGRLPAAGPAARNWQPRSLQLENEESNVVKRYYIRCETKKRKREWNIYLRD